MAGIELKIDDDYINGMASLLKPAVRIYRKA